MPPIKNNAVFKKKHNLVILLVIGLSLFSHLAFAQQPQGPPSPPPPPGELLKKINPFKKKNKEAKKDTAKAPVIAPAPAPGTPPPPPPNPLDLFRKKKKDSTRHAASTHQSA